MTGRFRWAIDARPYLGRVLLVAVGLVVAACNNSGGGSGY